MMLFMTDRLVRPIESALTRMVRKATRSASRPTPQTQSARMGVWCLYSHADNLVAETSKAW
jgi:hypothetical protein